MTPMPTTKTVHDMLRAVDPSDTHLFELARELTITSDRVEGHSSEDPSGHELIDPRRGEGLTSRPDGKDLLAQGARDGSPRLERALLQCELARPAADRIGAPGAVNRRFDQRPAEPRRAALGDRPGPRPATMMNLELVEGLLEKRGYGDELRKLLKSGRG